LLLLITHTVFPFSVSSSPCPLRAVRLLLLQKKRSRLEAFLVDDLRAGLVVLLLLDPHGLERRERRQDGAADPHAVLALGRRHDARLDGGGRQVADLLGQALGQAGKHGRAAGQHDVGVEVAAHADVALGDALKRQLGRTPGPRCRCATA